MSIGEKGEHGTGVAAALKANDRYWSAIYAELPNVFKRYPGLDGEAAFWIARQVIDERLGIRELPGVSVAGDKYAGEK